ncbi:gamma-glutamylcyclotransferase [Umezakia ovalisporum]|uniref:Gamma-glutamylcyclotransferase n=1 Tax=Umezakia ovalisporum FSS-43 TaxID=2740520 RepID=A0ABT6K1Q8_9CYAN|nr:gamma-glutamylcyclotransferase [Umezakia ovalisporum]MDH6056231.1 gamma-glutamylcyclotransferase [Umezakia ovalisporum FSS-43]MDH6070879.1 gamma-glutamylcyclotransferase [Umezakia ovalisporum CobakiLakeA]MDH6074524.1 gamma-glutamylcyclotransferase [Umezakia ovalisporum CS-1034]MDH6079157.1 gamma-glutamylcyclotransferase [Umezakia ovalisporum FSS-45]MDH6080662.1 gamma-glutamylcyclotransferase [Umezakia ovalisporum FSS-44]
MSHHSDRSRHTWVQPHNPPKLDLKLQQQSQKEPMFYYFAYGSCMCPVDLKRSLGENTHSYIIGTGILKGYRLGFYSYSPTRKCGVLDVLTDISASVKGVLYQLPWRLSAYLDKREGVSQSLYRRETVDIQCENQVYTKVRTYVVVNKLTEELAPNDWYFNVVLRGAVTCGLPEEYCWHLFDHMYKLQQRDQEKQILATVDKSPLQANPSTNQGLKSY